MKHKEPNSSGYGQSLLRAELHFKPSPQVADRNGICHSSNIKA